MKLKINMNGVVKEYSGVRQKKDCILMCLEDNQELSEMFFKSPVLQPALEANRDLDKQEVLQAFDEITAQMGYTVEWFGQMGGARQNSGPKSKGMKMVSMRMSDDEQVKVRAFLKELRSKK